MLEKHAQEEQKVHQKALLDRTRELIEHQFLEYRGHPLLTSFMDQFHCSPDRKQARYKALLLRGESRSGKTQRALSLFGSDCTLSVNCQGIAPALPCIKQFDRKKHAAILWDEIEETQVLNNKLVFQSGLQVVTLGQSACNAFAYDVMLHAVPMILCSNTFNFAYSKGKPLQEEDAQWLRENVIEVELPKGVKWYIEPEQCD